MLLQRADHASSLFCFHLMQGHHKSLHLVSSDASPVVIAVIYVQLVLVSSIECDPLTLTASRPLTPVGGGGYDLARLFRREVIGDIPLAEMPDFLAGLMPKKNGQEGTFDAHQAAGLQRWRERIADPVRFSNTFADCACSFLPPRWLFITGRAYRKKPLKHPLLLPHFSADGGCAIDWIRLLGAQLENGGT
jgi:hypothetical protein